MSRKYTNYYVPPPAPEAQPSCLNRSVNCCLGLVMWGAIGAATIGVGILLLNNVAPGVLAGFDKFIEGNGATGIFQREVFMPWLCKITQGLMCP